MFRKMFSLPPELQYGYVVSTVDVKEQKRIIYWDMPREMNFPTNYDKSMSTLLKLMTVINVVALIN